MTILGLLRKIERTAWTIDAITERIPTAVEFIREADRAYGDGGWGGAAAQVTLGGGWRAGAQTIHPALEGAIERGIHHGTAAYADISGYLAGYEVGEVVEREILPPWNDPLGHLKSLKYGVIVIFGEKGFGKSTLALRLAYTWRQKLGWPVDIAGTWREDRPGWAKSVSMKRVIARMQKVARYLDQEEGEEIDDGLDEEDLAPKKKAVVSRRVADSEIRAMSRRIVVIDEGHLFFSGLSGAGQQASRDAARGLQNQVRHLENIVVVICQKQSEMPRALKTSAIQFFKPAGEQFVKSDYISGEKRETQDTWRECLAGLAAIKTGKIIDPGSRVLENPSAREGLERCELAHNWYGRPPFETIKSWSYLIASGLGGRDYHGPIPNTALTAEQFRERDSPYALASGREEN